MLSRSLNLVLRLSPRRVLTQVAAKNSTASVASGNYCYISTESHTTRASTTQV